MDSYIEAFATMGNLTFIVAGNLAFPIASGIIVRDCLALVAA